MYYENFLNSIQPNTDIIPESAKSFNDMAIFTNRAIQDAYNEAVISIAANEMAVFESAVIQEADDSGNKKNILEYVKEFFKAIWEAIKNFFLGIIDRIKEFFDNQKMKALNKLKAKFDQAVDYIKKNSMDKAEIGEVVQYGEAKTGLETMQSAIKHGAVLAQNAFNTLKGFENQDEAQGFINRNLTNDMIEGRILKTFELKSTNGGKDVAMLMFNSCKRVKLDTTNIASNAEDLKNLITDVNGWISSVKKAYNETKKTVDGCMKDAKNLTNINKKQVKAYCASCKKILNVLTKMIGAFNSCYKKCYGVGLSAVKKTISIAKKKGANITAKNEGYEYGSYDYFEENFDFVLEEDDVEAVAKDDDEDIDFEMKED